MTDAEDLKPGEVEMLQVWPSWMQTALGELGQHEIAGPETNKRIIEYHMTTSLKATSDEVAWCSAFTNWVMAQHGIVGTNSAAAISWEKWGGAIEPRLGCIVVMRRNDPSNPLARHVGFLWWDAGKEMVILGGNQNNTVSLQAFNINRVVAYRWPSVYTSGLPVAPNGHKIL